MKKLLSGVIALILVLALAVPVQARSLMEFVALDIPESYDFTMSMDITVESNIDDEMLQSILAIVNEVNMDFSGSVEMEGLTGQMFFEIDVDIPAIGMPLDFRFWFDMDFEDLESPAMVYVMEMPAMLRLLLAGVMPELSSQFLVVDLTEMLQESMEEWSVFMGDFESMMNLDEEALEEMIEELRAMFAELWVDIEDYVDFEFEFDFDITEEDGEIYEVTYTLTFVLTITQDDEYVTIGFALEGVYYNFGNPTPKIKNC